MRSPRNLLKHELIGLKVEVAGSENKSQIGLEGKVVDETRNTIKIETKKGIKTVKKENTVFTFTLDNGKKVKIRGDIIVAKPEDRIKKKFKKW